VIEVNKKFKMASVIKVPTVGYAAFGKFGVKIPTTFVYLVTTRKVYPSF